MLWLVVLFAAPAFSAPAFAAQDDGVHIDPGSPPATEYALPLDSARGVGAGSAGARAAAQGAEQEPFGSGITPRRAAGTGSPAHAEPSASSGAGPDGPAHAGDGAATGPAPDLPPSSVGDSGGATAVVYSLGGAVVVLAVGGLLALTLRRRQSAT